MWLHTVVALWYIHMYHLCLIPMQSRCAELQSKLAAMEEGLVQRERAVREECQRDREELRHELLAHTARVGGHRY